MDQNSPGVNFGNVLDAEDFLLLEYNRGAWHSRWFPEGKAPEWEQSFFREIYLEADLELPELFPAQDVVLLEAASDSDGWRLVWSRYGYLQLFDRASDRLLASSYLPPATYVEPCCRVALLLSNPAYGRERACRLDLADTIGYSQLSLFAARAPESPLHLLFSSNFTWVEVPPVPLHWQVPFGSPLVAFKVYNTVRRELWQLPNDPGGPECVQDFSGASRVFKRYEAASDTVHLLSGPEFLRSDSYWLFTKVINAIPGQTRLRLHLSKYKGMPNMAPVFFWSKDRKHWRQVRIQEASDAAGAFRPLLLAPAPEFYLSSSLPFQELERAEFCHQALRLPYVSEEVIGHSVAGNPLVLLTATDSSVPSANKQHILIISGQHSPQEMIGGHAFLPLLTALGAFPGLLQRLAVHIVPTVNVDAAAYGSDGMNLHLFNTNRCWFEDMQPEVRAIIDWCQREPRSWLLFFDWHAGGTWRNHTLLWFNREVREKWAPAWAVELAVRQDSVLSLLGQHCGIRPEDGREHYFRGCCATDWFQVNMPECLPLTIEFSTCSNFDPRVGKTVPVSLDTMRMVGQKLALVFAELLEQQPANSTGQN